MSAEQDTAMLDQPEAAPSCEMSDDCTNPVTHIGNKGYIYCELHAIQRRQGYERTRKLTPAELRLVEAGRHIGSY